MYIYHFENIVTSKNMNITTIADGISSIFCISSIVYQSE